MMGSPLAKIQVTELMDVLRSGLAALVPVVERIGIPWTEGDGYDDWDAIASTLYDQLVVNTIRNASGIDATIDVARYDIIYPSYRELAHLEVVSPQTAEVLGVFVGFEAIERDFTRVKYAVYTAIGTVDTTTTRSVAFSECMIRVRIPSANGTVLEELTMAE